MVVSQIFNNFKREFETRFNKKLILLYENGSIYEVEFLGHYNIEVQSTAKHYGFNVTKVIQHNSPCRLQLTYNLKEESQEPLQKFLSDEELATATLRLLAYSFSDIKDYKELTSLEKLSITESEFKKLRLIIEELGFDQNIDRLKHKKR